MAFLRKPRSSDSAGAAEDPAASEVTAPEPAAAARAPKGRPTPKRRDSGRPSGPAPKAPQTRKEAVAWQKAQRATAQKLTPEERKAARVKQMAALRAGDPAALPARDRGPAKEIARDWVDSRRMMSNFMFALLPLILIGYAAPKLTFLPLLSIAFLGVLMIEAFMSGRQVRKVAVQRHGSVREGMVGLSFYCASRASMPRRWRLPAPRVQLGEKI
jgi:hypothetical protein